jgi:hypothetical protein
MPGVLLAIDPGIRGCGAAVFEGGILTRATYIKSHSATGNTAAACRAMANAVRDWAGLALNAIAVEWPRIYASRIREGKTKSDPNDLLALCGVDGALAMAYPYTPVDCFVPSDWKGQLKKQPCHARIRSRLSEAEREVMDAITPASLAHNVFDAIGVGLFRLGRFDRVRVIA